MTGIAAAPVMLMTSVMTRSRTPNRNKPFGCTTDGHAARHARGRKAPSIERICEHAFAEWWVIRVPDLSFLLERVYAQRRHGTSKRTMILRLLRKHKEKKFFLCLFLLMKVSNQRALGKKKILSRGV